MICMTNLFSVKTRAKKQHTIKILTIKKQETRPIGKLFYQVLLGNKFGRQKSCVINLLTPPPIYPVSDYEYNIKLYRCQLERVEKSKIRLQGVGWRVETGGWRREAGGWRLEGGGGRLEGGDWRSYIGLQRFSRLLKRRIKPGATDKLNKYCLQGLLSLPVTGLNRRIETRVSPKTGLSVAP